MLSSPLSGWRPLPGPLSGDDGQIMSDSRHTGHTTVVADGGWRLFEARRKERAAIRVAVRRRYTEEMKSAPFLRRLLLEWKIGCEIREEMRKRFPPGTLHVTPLSR
jgi:hypothetical protein